MARNLGLGKYVNAFAENEIGFNAPPHLREEDLKELGLPMRPRKVLLARIAELESVHATFALVTKNGPTKQQSRIPTKQQHKRSEATILSRTERLLGTVQRS